MQVDLSIERLSVNKLNHEKLMEQVQKIAKAADGRQQSNGVVGKFRNVIGPIEQTINGNVRYKYTFDVRLIKERVRSDTAAQKCLAKAKEFVTRKAEAFSWNCKGDAQEIELAAEAALNRPKFEVPFLSDQAKKDFFSDVYERNEHLMIIHSATRMAALTSFQERSHCLLYGDPGAAKTMVFAKLKAFYEHNSEVERVTAMNASTLTKAGLENFLIQRSQDKVLTEILFIDEIEKVPEESLNCLLSVMDGTAKIQKLTATQGKISKEAPVLLWASCNDIIKFKRFHSGALFSRFPNALPVTRPSKENMHKILIDKLKKREGLGVPVNYKWANICVNHAYDIIKETDPRVIVSWLDHEERLEDGSYFRDMEKIQSDYNNSLRK